jgi:ABC-2 type transport system ATP-binding protein
MNRKIGYVPDVCALPGFLTVGEVLSVAARLGGLGRVAEPDALMRVGLEGKAGHPVAGLSRGQAQRLGLAVALLRAPELLILDEPLSPLDDEGAARMVALLAELRASGCTVLLTAHRSPELTPLCDRMVWLADGRVVEERTLQR